MNKAKKLLNHCREMLQLDNNIDAKKLGLIRYLESMNDNEFDNVLKDDPSRDKVVEKIISNIKKEILEHTTKLNGRTWDIINSRLDAILKLKEILNQFENGTTKGDTTNE